MSRRCPRRPQFPAAPWAVALTLGVLFIALAPQASAQPFQVTYQVERPGPDETRVSGSVLNGSARDVFDVYVTVEALDAQGKVVGRGIAFVSPAIRPRGLVGFSAAVPAGTKAQNFKVYVSSFNYGLGLESP